MTNLIDFVIALFRDDALARAFASDPRQALASAGLEDADVDQLGAVAATAFPEIALNGGDHAVELQRAVAQHVGVDTIIPLSGDSATDLAVTEPLSDNGSLLSLPIDTEASHNDTEVHDNTTQLGSHNFTELASPDFTFGDVVLGDQNSASGDGAVAVSGTTSGAILSGDGAVLGDGNDVDNAVVQTGSNSNIAYGDGSSIFQDSVEEHEDVELPYSSDINTTGMLTIDDETPSPAFQDAFATPSEWSSTEPSETSATMGGTTQSWDLFD